MEEHTLQGVIFEPSDVTKSVSRNIKLKIPHVTTKAIIFFLLMVIGGLLFAGYQQYHQSKELEVRALNAEEQLKQAQSEYAQTFQEKVTLQSTLSRFGDESVATPSSNFFPIKFVVGNPQKIAQSFRPKSTSIVTLLGIQLIGNYAVGQKLVLTFYDFDGSSVEGEKKLGTATVSAKDISGKNLANFLFDTSFEIDPQKDYIFTVEGENADTHADIEFTTSDIDNTGNMYEFTPVLGKNNEILNLNHSWKIKEDYDLKYEALIAQS